MDNSCNCTKVNSGKKGHVQKHSRAHLKFNQSHTILLNNVWGIKEKMAFFCCCQKNPKEGCNKYETETQREVKAFMAHIYDNDKAKENCKNTSYVGKKISRKGAFQSIGINRHCVAEV